MRTTGTTLIKFLLAWVFVSAFYYLGNLLTGEVVADRESDIIHKIMKYLIALGISLLIILKYRSTRLVIFYISMLVVLFILFLFEIYGMKVTAGIDLSVVIFSFIGFTLLASMMSGSQIQAMFLVIVISAVLVSCVSFFEYLFMEPILGDYWRYIGGFRSISTLLNPNNLGLYLGAAILITLLNNEFSIKIKIVATTIIGAALFMSGSRTGFVALFAAMFIGTMFNRKHNIQTPLFLWLTSLFAMLIALALLIPTGLIGIPERASNLETASIRIDKYFSYITGFDFSYLLPDFKLERSEAVSESAYFYYFNSFGIILGLTIISSAVVLFRFGNTRHIMRTPGSHVLFILVIYYMTAMFFENTLMSFPNNQLFFIALGSVLIVISKGSKLAHLN